MRFTILLFSALSLAVAQTPAEDLIGAGHWKRARALVRARLEEAPDDPLAIYLMSQINFAFGHLEEPLKLAERAVSLAPAVAKYHRQMAEALGVMAQRSNLLQQAFLARRCKKEIETAIALDPRDIQAQRDLMEYYLLAPGLMGGDRKQAHAVAQRIGRIDRAQGWLAEARLQQFDRDFTREEAMLRRAVEVTPASYQARAALAQFYTKDLVNWDAAAASAREAVKLDPTRVEGYSLLAAGYAARGMWAELEAILEESDAQVADDWTPRFRAAEAMMASGGNLSAAEDNLRKYLEREPEGNQPSRAEARKKLQQIAHGPKTHLPQVD